jgi:hypothetical protein
MSTPGFDNQSTNPSNPQQPNGAQPNPPATPQYSAPGSPDPTTPAAANPYQSQPGFSTQPPAPQQPQTAPGYGAAGYPAGQQSAPAYGAGQYAAPGAQYSTGAGYPAAAYPTDNSGYSTSGYPAGSMQLPGWLNAATIIIWVEAGLLALAGVLVLILGVALGGAVAGSGYAGMAMGLMAVVAIIVILVAVVYFLAGKFLRRGNNVWRIVVTVLTALGIIGTLTRVNSDYGVGSTIFSIVLGAVVLYGLWCPPSQQYFKAVEASQTSF